MQQIIPISDLSIKVENLHLFADALTFKIISHIIVKFFFGL